MITREEYFLLKTKQAIYEKWAKQFQQKNGWTVIRADAVPPNSFDNGDRAAIEVFEFVNDPPERYFVYINEKENRATTWTGETLGAVEFGREYRDNFHGWRIPVTVRAINGRVYSGTYYKSAGDYARIKQRKNGGAML